MLFEVLMLLWPAYIFSQVDTEVKSNRIDSVSTKPDGPAHSLFLGTGYGSNMIYLGSTISRNQPYGYAALTYGFKSSFYATVSTVHLSGMDPFLAFNIGSLNYNHVFNSWFDISAGIYGDQVPAQLKDTLFSNFLYGDFSLGIDWRLIYTQLSAGMLLSEENVSYFQVKNSRYFKTPAFFNKKVYVSFDPYINVLMGTIIKAESSDETMVTISPVYRRRGSATPDTASTTYTYTTYSRDFGLMEADFGLPVAINTNFMTLEAEASYILPLYKDKGFPAPEGFVFMLSCYLKIF